MGDIQLFRVLGDGQSVTELHGKSVSLERSLQSLIERNLQDLLGVRFLASEFATTHGGRMDTLGIDENHSPVIIEYKRASNENIINQGLFYLDWLMDHRRDFEWLVMNNSGMEEAKAVDWESPRLICIAGDFTKYDAHAVNQMDRNIELVRYRRFDEDLLLLELLTATSRQTTKRNTDTVDADGPALVGKPRSKYKTFTQYLADADEELRDLYDELKAYILALGDDVQTKTTDNYIAFRRLKNFACVEIKPQIRHLKWYLKLDPETVELADGFSRDVRNTGHFGTGDLEVIIRDAQAFERAKPLIERSFDEV